MLVQCNFAMLSDHHFYHGRTPQREMSAIAAWLEELGLGRYASSFAENEIDRKLLPTLTADDLKDLGITVVGHRRRLLNAIDRLRTDTSPETSEVQALPTDETSRSTLQIQDTTQAERRQLTVMFVDLVGSTSTLR